MALEGTLLPFEEAFDVVWAIIALLSFLLDSPWTLPWHTWRINALPRSAARAYARVISGSCILLLML